MECKHWIWMNYSYMHHQRWILEIMLNKASSRSLHSYNTILRSKTSLGTGHRSTSCPCAHKGAHGGWRETQMSSPLTQCLLTPHISWNKLVKIELHPSWPPLLGLLRTPAVRLAPFPYRPRLCLESPHGPPCALLPSAAYLLWLHRHISRCQLGGLHLFSICNPHF